jgi:TonB family protein
VKTGAVALFLLLAGLAAAPAAAQLTRSLSVNAVDYPEGVVPGTAPLIVRARYELAPDGHIATCTIAHSSGRPALDAETCRILLTRARIRPEAGTMHGQLEFRWLGADSLRPEHHRGEPIPLTFSEVLSPDDYPPQAMQRGETGTVKFALRVSPRGAPVRCVVTSSSGSPSLDARTCEIAMTRGAFIPAADDAGPLGGDYHNEISWRLPDG